MLMDTRSKGSSLTEAILLKFASWYLLLIYFKIKIKHTILQWFFVDSYNDHKLFLLLLIKHKDPTETATKYFETFSIIPALSFISI